MAAQGVRLKEKLPELVKEEKIINNNAECQVSPSFIITRKVAV